MLVNIKPGRAEGRMKAPPSKSMAHRLILCAGLSPGISRISNVDMSEDILATIDCLRALGASISEEGDVLRIEGIDLRKPFYGGELACRECGSTLRFFIPICLMTDEEIRLTGAESLLRRPLSVYEEICADQDLLFEKTQKEVRVRGRLRPGDFELAGNISSQFISGLLFALPLLQADSRIRLIPPVESRSYILMTMQALEMFGIKTYWEEENTIRIRGGQQYRPGDHAIEGDYSNAAFFEALNMTGGNVVVEGLDDQSLQGDKIYRKHFARLLSGNADIDLSDCPDLGPVLMAVAAMNHGARFTGTRRLKIKESDRGQAMKQELLKMGVRVDIKENEIRVFSGLKRPEEVLEGHGDHRIVMALSVLLTLTGGKINGAEAVKKSLPDFFERLEALGVEIREETLL